MVTKNCQWRRKETNSFGDTKGLKKGFTSYLLECYFFGSFYWIGQNCSNFNGVFFFIRRISYSASSLVEGASSVAGLSLVWGTETDTLIETSRSSTVTVFISSKTFCCSASSSISTNPKPLERPLHKKKRSWKLESESVKWPCEMSK